MKRVAYERRVLLLALGAGAAGNIAALVLVWLGPFSSRSQWTLTIVLLSLWLGFALAARQRVAFPMRTVSNLLAALREGDFSIRARGAGRPDVLGEVLREVNLLGETLRRERLGAMEASALLRKVMEEIDVAAFAFDGFGRLRLVNRAGESILHLPAARALGCSAMQLGLGECLAGETPRIAQLSFPGRAGRWEIHRGSFREEGQRRQLVLITDLSHALRQEERQAWQRLIRVLGHELNNSLAPIKSVAENMAGVLARRRRPRDWLEDMRSGLGVIAARTDSLARFMNAYAQLAKLPPPRRQALDLGAQLQRAAEIEMRLPIEVVPGPLVHVPADPDQIEQLLINLLRNAVDAALETGGAVRAGWAATNGYAEIWIEDEGPGVSNPANLFVPFFTTKPGGSGIGLVLSRQIAEAHGGSLNLQNRQARQGCEARLRLPLHADS